MKLWRAKAGPPTPRRTPAATEDGYGVTAPELVEEPQTSVGEPELGSEIMASGGGPLMLEPAAPIEQAAWVKQAIEDFFAVEPPVSQDDVSNRWWGRKLSSKISS